MPGIPPDHVCLQFPNDDSYRDSIILGLISWACALPVNIFILNVFWCANAPDYDAAWLRWDFQRRVLLGRAEWHYATGERPRHWFKRMAATTWGVNVWYNLQQGLVERPQAWLFAFRQRRRAARGQEPLEVASRLGAGMMTQCKMEVFSVVGLVAVYLVWAIMVRVQLAGWPAALFARVADAAPPPRANAVLDHLHIRAAARGACAQRGGAERRAHGLLACTQGSLVYRLMGDEAQQKFTKGWGIGLAISQVTQFKARRCRRATLCVSVRSYVYWLCFAGHVHRGSEERGCDDCARIAVARWQQAVARGAYWCVSQLQIGDEMPCLLIAQLLCSPLS